MDDIDTLYEEAVTLTVPKKAHKRKSTTKTIKVRSSVELAHDNYKRAKREHKTRIKALRANIKSHKLMIRQARTSYKIVKLTNK